MPSRRQCGISYIRQEALADLLGLTIDAIQVADQLQQALQASQSEAEQDSCETRDRRHKQRCVWDEFRNWWESTFALRATVDNLRERSHDAACQS